MIDYETLFDLMRRQRDALAEALRNVLIADGVLNTDTLPDGPELLLAAQDYCASKAGQ